MSAVNQCYSIHHSKNSSIGESLKSSKTDGKLSDRTCKLQSTFKKPIPTSPTAHIIFDKKQLIQSKPTFNRLKGSGYTSGTNTDRFFKSSLRSLTPIGKTAKVQAKPINYHASTATLLSQYKSFDHRQQNHEMCHYPKENEDVNMLPKLSMDDFRATVSLPSPPKKNGREYISENYNLNSERQISARKINSLLDDFKKRREQVLTQKPELKEKTQTAKNNLLGAFESSSKSTATHSDSSKDIKAQTTGLEGFKLNLVDLRCSFDDDDSDKSSEISLASSFNDQMFDMNLSADKNKPSINYMKYPSPYINAEDEDLSESFSQCPKHVYIFQKREPVLF